MKDLASTCLQQETHQESIFNSMYSLLNSTQSDLPIKSRTLPNVFFQDESALPLPEPLKHDSSNDRKLKTNTACPHKDRKHYAKNMCNNCYHRQGRTKLAWACLHTDRHMYAKGKCQFCYLQEYHSLRLYRKKIKKQSKRFRNSHD